jgi:hypothetical protein
VHSTSNKIIKERVFSRYALCAVDSILSMSRVYHTSRGSSSILIKIISIISLLLSTSIESTTALSLKMSSSASDVASSNKRVATLRSIQSSLSSISDDEEISQRTKQMMERANNGAPLSTAELLDICHSLQNIAPADSHVNFDEYQEILKTVAHLSHKDWSVTSSNSDKLAKILLRDEGMAPHARQVLERILSEGNWDGAASHAVNRNDCQPWAVLVTGVNGIRKTTSIYQPWFPQLLQEALVCPPNAETTTFAPSVLPAGSNSFFRQLDHMIATLCNEDFMMLYALTKQELDREGATIDDIPKSTVTKYSDLKAAIFTRYRTLAELLGAVLMKQAQLLKSNCMMETSGKDVAMFHYIDHFFGSTAGNGKGNYNKLALHFTINDLSCAQTSVDTRMVREIKTGITAIDNQDVFDIIYANAGGPYGSEVLPGVQQASDDVWDTQVMTGAVGQDWYKATIAIHAHPTKPWTAQAVKPDGTLGTKFTFEQR